ncbi:hypothetical protein KUTeg_011389 [Tegillarca granosa]|uniref:Uncharacterized protein n=1 Tax=Tegillarca granosa TaxID=220873 RepID=A0ABQ9F0Y3_TEGGR|nr:hypothetical protein KUTeg_011389 [Tegillarca granosa]
MSSRMAVVVAFLYAGLHFMLKGYDVIYKKMDTRTYGISKSFILRVRCFICFKRTFCRCCLNLEAFPTFYKLKAIFINRSDQQSGCSPSGRYLYPQKPIRMDTICNNQKLFNAAPKNACSTGINQRYRCVSSAGTHAHSDGRLHYVCRHKSCSGNKTRQSIESQMFCKQFNNISYQDIGTLKRLREFHAECQVLTHEFNTDEPVNQAESFTKTLD